MDGVLIFARLTLAVVFGTASVTKLGHRSRTRQALTGFGVPPALAGRLALPLPLAELGVAVALLPAAWAWWGASGAFILLLLFSVGITVNLAAGRTPECHCFGRPTSGAIGWPTLLRNAALPAVAALIVWQGRDGAGPGVVGRVAEPSGVAAVRLGIAVVAIALLACAGRLVVQRLRHKAIGQASAGAPPTGLAEGTVAPAFSLAGLDGETVTLDALCAAGKPVLLAFTNPACPPCNALLPDLAQWQREWSATL